MREESAGICVHSWMRGARGGARNRVAGSERSDGLRERQSEGGRRGEEERRETQGWRRQGTALQTLSLALFTLLLVQRTESISRAAVIAFESQAPRASLAPRFSTPQTLQLRGGRGAEPAPDDLFSSMLPMDEPLAALGNLTIREIEVIFEEHGSNPNC